MNTHPDPVLVALDALVDALRANEHASAGAVARIEEIKALRARGLAYRDIADATGQPLVVELVTENLERLRGAGSALRRAHATALYDEGLTMDQIAALFGVSRQRVSRILQDSRR